MDTMIRKGEREDLPIVLELIKELLFKQINADANDASSQSIFLLVLHASF